MRIPGGKAVQRWLSQAYVELTFPISAQYASVFPLAKRAERLGLAYLKREVRDPEVRAKLTPRYAVGCKRPGFHNTYLATYNRDNVELVTEPIDKVTGSGVATTDGTTRDVDVLILATGFKVMDVDALTFDVTGSGGLSLADFWDQNRMQAYEGVSVPGFPNWFMILGPYGFNGASYFTLIENQARHIVRCLRRAREEAATAIEVTPEANARYFQEVLSRRERQVFFRGSCDTAHSYYFDRHGDAPFRPSTTAEVAWRAGHFPLEDYRFTRSRSSRSRT
jgi:cyclohexanone monooxygenase